MYLYIFISDHNNGKANDLDHLVTEIHSLSERNEHLGNTVETLIPLFKHNLMENAKLKSEMKNFMCKIQNNLTTSCIINNAQESIFPHILPIITMEDLADVEDTITDPQLREMLVSVFIWLHFFGPQGP